VMFVAARLVLSAVLSLAAVVSANAQAYPSKPIRLIAPFPAGGPTDTTARVAARALQARLGQTVVVENQGGAGGTIGARNVANAAPDGYTLMMIAVANTFGTQPVLYKLDFNLPVTSARELVAYAKANPGKLNYGAAIGIGPHFLMELFKIKSGVNIVHVPYRGSGPIIADVIGGQIQLMMSGKSVLLPHVQAGKMRAVAVAAGERWPELPDVGTLVEAGYMDAAYDSIFGIVAPTGTPAPVIAALNAAMNEGLKTDEVRASLAKLGIDPRISTVAEFSALIAEEAPRWAEVVRVTGIKAGE
jgi:tripartite-type tricarboxylate transporter receptor subunit TctC